ncbi:glycosyltransferase family 4 protein [Roseivirga sp. E12]|uniref:glycosyltransferase family 4 protein n=1 Tax=Roseivirga sp. E12 TaxID=2819237 RepID=UPI001ABBF529|nr:glycosyltransferase family 4 protein [Roseivirga sp. E12]
MIILVISHTEHYLDPTGKVCGWGPTVREIDHLANTHGKVIHVACLSKKTPPPRSSSPYESGNVEFIGIPSFGGTGLHNKLQVIITAPIIIKTVFTQLKRADIFQFRAPTAMGIYLIPVLTWFSSKWGWFKYAGNWIQKKKPMSYAFQKKFLELYQKRPVTVNGNWQGQKSHVFTFENPSLSLLDLKKGEECFLIKKYEGPLTACFVGRLEKPKGVERIIKSLHVLSEKGVKEVHFVGDGNLSKEYKSLVINSSVKCHFHGFLNKLEISEIYRCSHLLLLPTTASEGFPKVIAEAANYGCVPVVSNVSSIPQYINETNGFIWDVTASTFENFLSSTVFDSGLRNKAQSARLVSRLFTFRAFSEKLDKWVFNQSDRDS